MNFGYFGEFFLGILVYHYPPWLTLRNIDLATVLDAILTSRQTRKKLQKCHENYRQICGKSKASLWRNLSTGKPPKFVQTILRVVALVYWYFFRTAILQKLSDTRFSYKHCSFSRVCLLVKMASKTVTRSIIFYPFWIKTNVAFF